MVIITSNMQCLYQNDEIYGPCVSQIPGIKAARALLIIQVYTVVILHQFILLKYIIASFNLEKKVL